MDLKIFTRRSFLQTSMKIRRYQGGEEGGGGGGGVDSIFESANSLSLKLNRQLIEKGNPTLVSSSFVFIVYDPT